LSDPTSHNLWPLELIIAAVVGVVCSLAGAVIGSLPSWLSKRWSIGNQSMHLMKAFVSRLLLMIPWLFTTAFA